MATPVFAIDRAAFASRTLLLETIKFHVAIGSIVQVEDRNRPRDDRLLYVVRPMKGAIQVFNARGRQIGIFANLDALISHAEAVTAT